MRELYCITHPEVVARPDVPVPRWPLSERGKERMRALLALPWVAGVGSVYASTEQKAIDGGRILADHRGLPLVTRAELGERDRSSTGYLSPDEFRATVARAFAHPEESVRGWESSAAAQRRIVSAVEAIVAADRATGSIAIVSHGGVAALLLCHVTARPIAVDAQQPGATGGNTFALEVDPSGAMALLHGWRPIDP